MAHENKMKVVTFPDGQGQVAVSEPFHLSTEEMRILFCGMHIQVNTGAIVRKAEKFDPTKTCPIEGVYEQY